MPLSTAVKLSPQEVRAAVDCRDGHSLELSGLLQPRMTGYLLYLHPPARAGDEPRAAECQRGPRLRHGIPGENRRCTQQRPLHTKPSCCRPTQQVSSITGRGDERWAGDVWVRPLSDGSFLFVLVNRDPLRAHRMDILFGDGGDGSGCDLFDSSFDFARVSLRGSGSTVGCPLFMLDTCVLLLCPPMPPSLSLHPWQVRDLDARADLGVFPLAYSAVVPPHDARVFRVWQANGTETAASLR